MKDRIPRKLKKLAKKHKAKHDAMVTATTAITAALGAARMLSIASRPIPKANGNNGDDIIKSVLEKKIALANCILQTSYSAAISMQQIKPWREHV